MYADALSSSIYLSATLAAALCAASWIFHQMDRTQAAFNRTIGRPVPPENYIGPIWAGILTGLVHGSIALCGYLLTFYSRGDLYWFVGAVAIATLGAETGIPVEKNAPAKKDYRTFVMLSFGTDLALLLIFGQMIGMPMGMSIAAAIWINIASYVMLRFLDKTVELSLRRHPE